jgi:hypothetical protein
MIEFYMTEYDASLIRIIPPASTLYGLIQQISHRPGMYFEDKSLSALYNFIKGFEMACYVHSIDEHELPPFGEFHEFVRRKTGFSESTSGWKKMLLSFNNEDEEKALEMFFNVFGEFAGRDVGGMK